MCAAASPNNTAIASTSSNSYFSSYAGVCAGPSNPSTSSGNVASSSNTSMMGFPNPSANNLELDLFLIDNLVANLTMNTCGNCEEGKVATNKCTDCNVYLCDLCCNIHISMQMTKDHRINRISRSSSRSSSFMSSLPAITPNSSIGSPPENPGPSTSGVRLLIDNSCLQPTSSKSYVALTNFCDTHKLTYRHYCLQCAILVCIECAPTNDHCNHKVISIKEAVDKAKNDNAGILNEMRQQIPEIQIALQYIDVLVNKINYNAQKSSCDIKNYTRRHIMALEKRQNDILHKIEQARRNKVKELSYQYDFLDDANNRLHYIHQHITSSNDFANVVHFLRTSQRAAHEIRKMDITTHDLIPYEDDVLYFTAPEFGLLPQIATTGGVIVRGRNNKTKKPPRKLFLNFQLMLEIPSPQKPPLMEPGPTPRMIDPDYAAQHSPDVVHYRPVYNCPNRVIAKYSGPQPTLVFGREGAIGGDFCRPWGVCCNHLGHIIVADRSNCRVQIFDKSGNFLHQWGRRGSGRGQFDRPAGIACNSLGHIIVVDKDNHRVQVFDPEGNFILMFGGKGSANGKFNYPWDVACNAAGNIAVSDTRNHRVQIFTADGVFLTKYGHEEPTSHQLRIFDCPRGVCYSPTGALIVTDFNNHKIIFIDKDLETAQCFGIDGTGPGQLSRPQGIICDDDGNLVVADSKNHRIQVFNKTGELLYLFGRPGRFKGDYERPSGICLSPEGRIIVVDFGNHRVQVY